MGARRSGHCATPTTAAAAAAAARSNSDCNRICNMTGTATGTGGERATAEFLEGDRRSSWATSRNHGGGGRGGRGRSASSLYC